jgi:hypothetical protein
MTEEGENPVSVELAKVGRLSQTLCRHHPEETCGVAQLLWGHQSGNLAAGQSLLRLGTYIERESGVGWLGVRMVR